MNLDDKIDIELEGGSDSHPELKNIFEEYDHHLPWNELGIYDLHWYCKILGIHTYYIIYASTQTTIYIIHIIFL